MSASSEPSGHTLVLALGNPLRGDDGVGAAVLQSLAESGRLPAGTDLVDGGSCGLETALLLQDYRRAIIVDAADMDLAPGSWTCFQAEQVELRSGDLRQIGTVHSAGLGEALQLGEALGTLPPDVWIYGIQPRELGWEPGLSEAARLAVPAVCQAILELIGCPQGPGDH